MTLSRGHSFKIQSSNQFKLKSNFKSKSSTLIQCQPNVDMPIDHIEKAANMSIIQKKCNRTAKQEHTSYGQEINSNPLQYVKGSMSTGENGIQSTELLTMTPNIETNHKKIRLTMAPMHTQSHRSTKKHACYSKLRRSTAQPILRSWFGWFRPKVKNAAFYSPPLEHPTKGIKIQIHINENPNGVHGAVNVDTASSNEDEEISNSSLQNVDQVALKDELAAYMDEIRAREKR